MDLECYPDYFLAKFQDEHGGMHSFGMWDGQPLDIQSIVDILARVTIVGFNSENYDVPMLVLALHNATCAQLKEANDDIIVRKMKWWEFYRKWGIERPDYIDHIDIMEVAPGVRINLKMYMGRLHAPTLQDLPYDPSTALDAAGRFVVSEYCGNDLVGTRLLRQELRERLELRNAIGERYGVDVRSKSDAQIAETVIKSETLKYWEDHPQFEEREIVTGGDMYGPHTQRVMVPKSNKYIEKRYIPHGFTFGYDPPDFIDFVTPQMKELLAVVRRVQFTVSDKEEALMIFGDNTGIKTGVQIPPELKGRDIIIGKGVYRLGIGGLHSQEKSCSYFSNDAFDLIDIDVKSYYPSMILAMNMVPEQLGEAFRIIYRAIYERRLLSKSESARIADLWECTGGQELKDEADRLRTESDGLKIVLNGVFGKLFSKHSILYAPELGIRTTITGQLSLLMLIEMMECSGITVVSANTDGIVLMVPKHLRGIADNIVKWWEARTKLEMEYTFYKSIHQRDVNNYIAIDTKGKVKRKGVFNQGGVLSGPQGKGPNMDICADAVVAWLKEGTPISETIRACTDVRKFIVLRGVTGGGTYKPPNRAGEHGHCFYGGQPDEHLGKAVRWVYGLDESAYIADAKGGRVAGSGGAVPLMKMPGALPGGVNYGKYFSEALEMVADIGLPVRYWYHPESDAFVIDHACVALDEQGCDEITKRQYDKRKV